MIFQAANARQSFTGVWHARTHPVQVLQRVEGQLRLIRNNGTLAAIVGVGSSEFCDCPTCGRVRGTSADGRPHGNSRRPSHPFILLQPTTRLFTAVPSEIGN